MAPPKDIARSYPKRGLTADVGFRSEPKFCGDGAATFPTTSDYAQTAASADLALGETYTICAWVRSVKPIGGNHVVNVGVSGTIKFSIAFFGSVPNPAVYCYNGVSGMTTTGVFESDPHTWYHIAMVIKPGAGNSQIFINGIDRTASHSLSFPLSGSPVLHIGGDYSASNGNWQGDLANVALFTSSLTEDQVRQAMRASDYGSHAAIATLEAFYPLSADFNDSTGNHNATASGSPLFRPNRPQLPRGLDLTQNAAQARVYSGRAIELDGAADYLETTLDSALGSTFTITAWIYKDNVSSNRFVALAGNGSTGAGSASSIYVNVDKLGGWDGSTNLSTTLSLSTNRWYHVALVANGTTTLTYYLDGQSDTVTSAGVPNPNSSRFRVGAYSPSALLHDGKISGMKVFNQALTADQIKDLYHHPEQVLPTGVSASALIHYCALSDYNDTGGTGGRYFQDSAGSNALEDKSSASMAFAQPVPCPQLGLQQSATRVYFERNNVRAQTNIGSAPGATCTMSAWVMVDQSFSFQYFMKNGTSITANNFFAFAINSARKLYAVQNSNPKAIASIPLSDYGEWNHVVAMTKTTAPYVRFFINGVEDTSITDSGMVAFNLNSTFVEIGSDGTNHLKGFVNDCAIWDVELSDPEVASLYNSGVQGMDVSTVQSSNLKGWWKCDDLTSFKDYSGNGANAALTASVNAASFPENASGSTIVGDFSMKRKGVSVLNFAESANAAEAVIPAESSLFPNAIGYTISVWVKGRRSSNAGYVIRSATTTTLDRVAVATQTSNEWLFEFPRISGSSTYIPCPLTYDGEWHCMTATIDSATNTIKAYTDGILQATLTTSVVNTAATPSDISINPDVSTYWSGVPVALLKISQQTWTDDEVQRNYYSDLRLIKGLANE